jgi:YHS domain-containing protein
MKRSLPVVFGAAFVLAACGGGNAPEPKSPEGAIPSSDAPAQPTETTAAVKAPGEAQPGDTARCPVSGEEFEVQATSPSLEHAGKTYYFCCSGCKKKFENDPSTFLNKT